MMDVNKLHVRDRLIVALDLPSAQPALDLVKSLGDSVTTYKVGKQLFTAEGPDLVRKLVRSGRNVFLDLKFHDIPTTVSGAVAAAAGLGVSMLTVHAAGGSEMLRQAVEAAAKAPKPPLVLAVTVLTSLRDLHEIGIDREVKLQVSLMAELARQSGCRGVVASPEEASSLRKQLGPDFAIVTPGVRPLGVDAGDQKRAATPASAVAAGASHIVVGLPITGAKDPAAAVRAIFQEMTEAAEPQPVRC